MAECERLADAVAAGNGTPDVLLNAIKTRQAEREQAEARVAEIEAGTGPSPARMPSTVSYPTGGQF